MKYYKWWFKTTRFYSHRSRGQKSEIEVSTGLVPLGPLREKLFIASS